MDAIPADYFQYYYCQDEVLAELQAKPTTRAEDILGWSTGYWAHYAEQAESDDPQLDPKFSRGGIHELELAIDAMDAVFNGRTRCSRSTSRTPAGCCRVRRDARRRAARALRRAGRLDRAVARAGAAAPARARARARARRVPGARRRRSLGGTRRDAIHALAAHPLMIDLDRTERVYDELAVAHREHLPARLCPRSVPACSTSGSTAATRRRSRSRAGRRPHQRARAHGLSDVYEVDAELAVAEIVRGARAAIAAARRRPTSPAPTTRSPAPTGRPTSPTTSASWRGRPGGAHRRRQRRDRRDPLRRRGRRRLLARVRHGHRDRGAGARRPHWHVAGWRRPTSRST